jgi:hypothetical protein
MGDQIVALHIPDESLEMMVYEYIVDYKRENDGNAPSYRQIMREFDLSSLAQVHAIIQSLTLGDYLAVKNRRICVHGGQWDLAGTKRG